MALKLYHEAPFIVNGQLVKREPPQALRQAGVVLLQQCGLAQTMIADKPVFLHSVKIVTRVSGRVAHLS